MPISTPISTMLQRLAILAICILFALTPGACTRAGDLSVENPAAPVGAGSPEARLLELVQPIRADLATPVEVIVEVTRVVTQSVIIEATPAPPQPCAHARFEATGEVTIGALLPLSGQAAFSAGFAMQTALSLAVERIQREGLLGAATPRLVTYDTAARADRAAEFAHRLITLDCAAVIIGGFHNHVALATAPVANAHQVPYIVLHAAADELTATRGTSVFRIAPSMSMYAQMPASLITQLAAAQASSANNADASSASQPIDAQPIEDVLLIVESAAKGAAIAQAIAARLTAIQVQSEVLTVDLPSPDFSSTVARILSRPVLPDMVFILMPGDAALLLQSQLLHAGIGPTRGVGIVSSHSPRHAATFWQAIPHGQDTLISHFGPRPAMPSARGQAFLADYEPYADGWPPAWVFAAYDAAFLFAHAARQAETLAGSHIAHELRQLDVELSAGRYYFPDANPDVTQDEQSSPTQRVAWGQAQSMWQQWPEPPLYYLRYATPGQTFAEMEVVWPSAPETARTNPP